MAKTFSWLSVLMAVLALTLLSSSTTPVHGLPATAEDQNENCEFWASIGECDKNPNYMLRYCTKSCNAQKQAKLENIPSSFYEIKEKDIHGNELDFERFKGKVVYMVNVASYCGYTESNYRQIKDLQKYYHQGLEIVLSPCNAFGQQEPGSNVEIYKFADKKGFSGIILSKDEVNGAHTRESFRFLKAKTGKSHINWNFDGKFLIDRRGNAHAVDDADLESKIVELLNQPATEL